MLIRDAAVALETTPAALYKAIERKQLRVERIGQTVLVHESALDEYRRVRREPGRPRKTPPAAPPGPGAA